MTFIFLDSSSCHWSVQFCDDVTSHSYLEEFTPSWVQCYRTSFDSCSLFIHPPTLPLSLRASLQSVRDSISNQVSAVFQLYEQNKDSLDLSTVTERSTTTPSLSDMLEWLQDAERHYRQQYPLSSVIPLDGVCVLFWVFFFSSTHVFIFLRRKTLLQTLRADDLSLLESAPKRWKSLESPTAEDHITG